MDMKYHVQDMVDCEQPGPETGQTRMKLENQIGEGLNIMSSAFLKGILCSSNAGFRTNSGII